MNIMRSVALLQTRSWKFITTGILSTLALVLLTATTVRPNSPRIFIFALLRHFPVSRLRRDMGLG